MKPANAAARVVDGDVAGALRALKRSMTATGLLTLMRHDSRLYAYTSPSKRRLEKQRRHRARVRRNERRRAQREEEANAPRRHPAAYPRRPGAPPSPASITSPARSSAAPAQEAVIA